MEKIRLNKRAFYFICFLVTTFLDIKIMNEKKLRRSLKLLLIQEKVKSCLHFGYWEQATSFLIWVCVQCWSLTCSSTIHEHTPTYIYFPIIVLILLLLFIRTSNYLADDTNSINSFMFFQVSKLLPSGPSLPWKSTVQDFKSY